MSVESDMEAGFPAALFALVGTPFACDENNIYFDTMTRKDRMGTEVLITTISNPHVTQEVGDMKSFQFSIQLFKAVRDSLQAITDSARIEKFLSDSVDLIVKKYHGVPEEFMNGLLNVLVDSVICQRSGPVIWVSPTVEDPRTKAFMEVSLEIVAYEE